MIDTWKTQAWRIKASAFTKDKSCAWCGSTENLVPHHPKRKGGYTHEEYLSLEGCIVLCKKCNFMEDKGYKLCPVCKKQYYKPKRGRDKMCWGCFTQTPYGKSVKAYYDIHPNELKKKQNRKFK